MGIVGMISELKRIQKNRIEQAIQYDDVQWNGLLLTFKEPHIKVLEVVYEPEPKTVIYRHIYQALRQINYSERSGRRYINLLADKGLLTNFTSTFGIVKPVTPLTNNIHSLIKLYRNREKHLNTIQQNYYDQIANLIVEDKTWCKQDDIPN